MHQTKFIFSLLLVGLIASSAFAQASKKGTLVTKTLRSSILRGTLTHVDSNRIVKVYLPPDYNLSRRAYPVVYYFHSVFSSAEKVLADGNLVQLVERGFSNDIVGPFILVVADYSSPTTGSLYENSLATGRWLDFTVQELVPFIDSSFRTIRHRDSRAAVGEMMGGRGAFMLAMRHPDTFSILYAMNPVGTGLGLLPVQTYPNWKQMHQARSFSDLQEDRITQIFIAMAQAFLPNPGRPPFYCDFIMETKGDELVYHAANASKQFAAFSLSDQLESYAANLKTLRGIAFDWSRYDPIQDHVQGSESFSRNLDFYGIEHEAEAYRGVYWAENWKEHGRFEARVLPFLNRYLVFESNK